MSNLLIGSALKMVFCSVRPWALFAMHAMLLYLWESQSCENPSEAECKNPRFPMRDALQNFGIGFPEITSIITMCLLVVSFYCTTCIGIYREIYFAVSSISVRVKSLCMFIRALEDNPQRRWALARREGGREG
jgi:hypothetical protein